MSLCIMIVEDEMLLALDLENILLAAGHTVAGQASDMSEALNLAERCDGRIDIAIMDVNLARGSNGVETAAALRQQWNIPSLFVSGNLDEKTRALALEWKPIGFVGKPYSEREVLAAIASVTKAPV